MEMTSGRPPFITSCRIGWAISCTPLSERTVRDASRMLFSRPAMLWAPAVGLVLGLIAAAVLYVAGHLLHTGSLVASVLAVGSLAMLSRGCRAIRELGTLDLIKSYQSI